MVLLRIDDDFIRFIVECVVNLVEGNFVKARKQQYEKFKAILKTLTDKKLTRYQQRTLITSDKGLQLLKVLVPLIKAKFC